MKKEETCRLATKKKRSIASKFSPIFEEGKGAFWQRMSTESHHSLARSLARNCFDPYFPLLLATIKGYHLQNNGRRLLRPRRRRSDSVVNIGRNFSLFGPGALLRDSRIPNSLGRPSGFNNSVTATPPLSVFHSYSHDSSTPLSLRVTPEEPDKK